MSETSPQQVVIYTDGACKGNPGPGGWGALLRFGPHEKELFGGERETTNNRMELTAVIRGLASLPGTCRVHLVLDSEYVSRGITEWLPRWIANGWRAGRRRARRLKNVRLWQRLAEQLQRHEVDCQWVRGHSGHPENEQVDELARAVAVRQANMEV